MAWNPKFDSGILGKLFPSGKTVIRAGYGRSLNRINGINQVQVIDSPASFGVVTGQSNTPRQMEFGLRIFF